MTGQSSMDASEASPEDRDNLAYLAEALDTAMAGRRADGLLAEAGGSDGPRARQLLAELVAEAVESKLRLPEEVAALPEQVARLQAASGGLREGQAVTARKLDELAGSQARQHETVLQELEGLKASLSGMAKRLNLGLTEDLEAIEERIAKLADSTLVRERQQRRAATVAAVVAGGIALVVGIAAGAVLVAGSPAEALDALRALFVAPGV